MGIIIIIIIIIIISKVSTGYFLSLDVYVYHNYKSNSVIFYILFSVWVSYIVMFYSII